MLNTIIVSVLPKYIYNYMYNFYCLPSKLNTFVWKYVKVKPVFNHIDTLV